MLPIFDVFIAILYEEPIDFAVFIETELASDTTRDNNREFFLND